MATTPQISYLTDLALKLWANDPARVLREIADASVWSPKFASAKIDEWKAAVAAKMPAPKAIPAGTYLAMGKVVKVKISKKTNAPYLIAEDGTYLGALKGDAPAMLAEIEADPKAAAIAYGKKTGNCCICSKTLTNPDSIAAGIGPVCAGKF